MVNIVLFILLWFTGCTPVDKGNNSDSQVRLISTNPALTEIITAIGVGQLLAGRTDVCNYPPGIVATIPVTGGFGTPWLEQTLLQHPTHLLESALANPAITNILQRHNIQTIHIPCDQLDEIPAAIRSVGEICKAQQQAEILAHHIEVELNKMTSSQHTNPELRTLILLSRESPVTAGRQTFISELLTLAGGENIATDESQKYFHISLEWIIKQNPDIIIALFPTSEKEIRQYLAQRSGWRTLSAVKAGRVYAVENLDTVSRPSPRVLEGLKTLQQILQRDRQRDKL